MSKWLLLIPTEFERGFVAPLIEQSSADQNVTVTICGFGPIAAAARTAALIVQHQPEHVLLVGIAGSYRQLAVGKAYRFSSVGCYGIGVGTGASFQTAQKMGWAHWTGDQPSDRIDDVISIDDDQASLQLLTVCAASENQDDVDQRRSLFPDAVAEDMEGFAVAAACRLAKTRLTIVRGISNVAGDRDKSNWKIEQAITAAWKLAEQLVDGAGI